MTDPLFDEPLPAVVFLDHVGRLSGAEIALHRLCDALVRTGAVRVHVILGEDGALVDRLRDVGVDTEVLPIGAAARELRRDRTVPGLLPVRAVLETVHHTLQLSRRLRQLRPSVVHSFSMKSNLYGGVAARLAGIPHIWQANDRIAADYLPRPVVGPLRFAARFVSTMVIANSAATLATVGPAGVVLHPPLPRGWPAAAPGAERGRDTGDRDNGVNGLVVGMVGRIAPWKGQDVFLRAFASAFAQTPHRAVVAGAALFGEDGWELRLREICAELGIAEQVDFLGHIDDVAELLPRLDVLVHCSRIPEPFGQVVAEGMAVGLPVVAAAAGGPLELIDEGRTGLLTPPGDIELLAAALRRLEADPQLRRRLGGAARIASGRLDPTVIALRHVAVYRSTARPPGRSSGWLRRRLLAVRVLIGQGGTESR